MTLTVHHLQVSLSERVIWLCEELGLDYELKNYIRDPLLAPPAYKALHPIGTAPVIQDGEKTIGESSACLEYIAHVHGKGQLFPKPGDKNYADFLFWWHTSNGSFQPTFSQLLALKFAGLPADNLMIQGCEKRLTTLMGFIDSHFSAHKWFAGDDFTAADIMPMCTLTTLRQFLPRDLSAFPNLLRWINDCAARPAYRRAMSKGDPQIDVDEQIKAQSPPVFPPLAKM